MPNKRLAIDRGVVGSIFIALDVLVAVEPIPRNIIDGVWVEFMVVVDLLFTAENFPARDSGGVSANAVFNKSSLCRLRRSRKSHADVCLVKYDFGIVNDVFFVVLLLIVARYGDADAVGVVSDFALDAPIDLEYFTFGVFLCDIFVPIFFSNFIQQESVFAIFCQKTHWETRTSIQ